LSKLDELFGSLSPVEQEMLLAQVAEYRAALDREGAQDKFIAYVHAKGDMKGFVLMEKTVVEERGDSTKHTTMVINKEIKLINYMKKSK
jgi:hypothetical protein